MDGFYQALKITKERQTSGHAVVHICDQVYDFPFKKMAQTSNVLSDISTALQSESVLKYLYTSQKFGLE